MNPRLTRQELLRRGAAGGALLAFPSLLAAWVVAAVAADDGWRRAQRRSELRELAVLHGHDADSHGRRADGADDARAVQGEDRDQGQLLRDHQLERRVLRQEPGPALVRAMRSDATSSSSTDNSQFPSSTSPRSTARSSTRASSRTSTTSSTRSRARASTRAASTRSPGSPASTGSAGTRTSPGVRSRA